MAVRGGAVPRFGVLCALLLGLFLMHGDPAAAAGCHRAVAVGAHHHQQAGPGRTPTVQRPDGLCVATPARASGVTVGKPGPAPLGPLPRRPAAGAGPVAAPVSGCRAPPARGRAVLLRVCVSRT
ncbi:hypothetical protein AB0D08_14400 [Kitasatospora sp. NPDC048540]|uniref:hypothetical protein n=1 Tax=Kitasatospora sp. NPDC048540 TaxID=3155634 RepID=UPI0033D4963B